MLVRDRMTSHPTTVAPDTTFEQALRLMREKQVRRFPVINSHGRLVGIVSQKDLLNAGPSPATTLARFELPALLEKLKVSDLMTRGVIVVEPDVPLEEAARIMADNKIGGLPVVDAQHVLVGIITETDIFRTMVDMLGARSKGLRLTFRGEHRRGALAALTNEIARQGGNVVMISVFQSDDHVHSMVTLKVEDADEERLVATLRGWNAEILDVREV